MSLSIFLLKLNDLYSNKAFELRAKNRKRKIIINPITLFGLIIPPLGEIPLVDIVDIECVNAKKVFSPVNVKRPHKTIVKMVYGIEIEEKVLRKIIVW